MIKVINKRLHPASREGVRRIYIGRGSSLGNPWTSMKIDETFAKFQATSREESIQLFANYLNQQIKQKNPKICQAMNAIYSAALIGEVHLECYCKPHACHGDVIKQVIESVMERYAKT